MHAIVLQLGYGFTCYPLVLHRYAMPASSANACEHAIMEQAYSTVLHAERASAGLHASCSTGVSRQQAGADEDAQRQLQAKVQYALMRGSTVVEPALLRQAGEHGCAVMECCCAIMEWPVCCDDHSSAVCTK